MIVIQIMTYCHHLRYVYIPPVGVYIYGGTRMTQPTTALSLRITDDDLALIDARVGVDGARSRSDVVRMAIQEFLHNQPLLQDMKTVRIPLGRHDQLQLAKLYELQGITPELAAQEGIKLYMQKAAATMGAVADTFDSALVATRSETMRRSEYQE